MALQEQQQQQQPQEQEWRPSLSAEQTRSALSMYEQSPQQFDVENLRQHATHYNLPFYEGEFSIRGALKQIAGGFLEGFTTLNVVDHPDNEYESILRNISHLAGFAPGIIAGPAKLLKLKGLEKAALALSEKSVPMWGAKIITKKAKSVAKSALKVSGAGRFESMNVATKFLMGDRARHVAEGAFHLGVASSISSVWDGVDGMMQGFFGGAIAGGVFRGIGNIIGHGKEYLINPGSEKAEKFARGLAGSLFMGIPATQRGATTPEQIYEYLLGAYFGGKEQPWFKAKAGKGIQKMEKMAQGEGDLAAKMEATRDPELLEEWGGYPDIVKKELKRMATERWRDSDENAHIAYEQMRQLGILDQIPEKDFKDRGIDAGYVKLQKVLKETVEPSDVELVDMMGISGAALGADSYWGYLLNKAGRPVVHYLTPEKEGDFTKRFVAGPNKQTSAIPRVMSERELLDNIPLVDKAAVNLNKRTPKQSQGLILRNAEIVKKSSKIYAIGEIYRPNTGGAEKKHAMENPQLHYKAVTGGTGWGVQMAINARKPVFVFDTPSKSWHIYNYKVKGGGKFVPYKGTPDLVQRPGLIGTRGDVKWEGGQKLSKEAKRAMKELVAKAFPEAFKGVKPSKEAKLPGAVDEKDIKMHPKSEKRLGDIGERMTSLAKDIEEIQEVIKEGKVDKIRLKELNKDLKAKEKENRDLDKLSDKILGLRETDYISEDTNRIVTGNDSDMDTGSPYTLVGTNSIDFTKEYLKDFWNVTKNPSTNFGLMQLRAEQVQNKMLKYIDKGSSTNRAKELVEDIEGTFEIQLPPEARGKLRQWVRTNNLGQKVRYVKTIGKKIELLNKDNPMSYSGKRKEQIQPASVIEVLYRDIFKGKEKKGSTDDALVVWDEITVEENNMLKDIPIFRYKKHLANQKNDKGFPKYKKAEVEKLYNAKLGEMIRYMYKTHDMVPLGGAGDKARIVFVKLHPDARAPETMTHVKKQLTTIKNKLKKVDKKAVSLFNESKLDYKQRFGKLMGEQFDRNFYSNLLYDMQLNGFDISKKNFAKNLETLFGDGFIPNAVNYNKRAQIWLNSFFNGDKSFFRDKGLGMTKDGNFKYILVSDPETPKIYDKKLKKMVSINSVIQNGKMTKSTDLGEHVDGAIIVRTDVLNKILEDSGVPQSGQNKSFIVSRDHKDKDGNSLGTMLGKYMMHDAGPEQTAEMAKKGLHMMVMTSAAKQTGTRNKKGDYNLGKDGELILKNTTDYELDPSHVFYSPSTFGSAEMLKPQIWVKQMFTNLHQYGHAPISKELIQDIFDSTILKKVEGTEEGNGLLENYLEDFSSLKLNKIFKNLDTIGTNEIVTASKKPGAEEFANRLFDEMMKANIEVVKESVRDGEMTAEQAEVIVDDMADFQSSTQRLLDAASLISRTSPDKTTGFPAYFHRYIRDYRNQVMHNWVTNQVTRPKMANASVGFIRPYDKFLQKKFPELNDRDDIFYLDDAYMDMNIELAHKINNKTNIKLGELWDLYSNDKITPALKEYAKEVFDAVVLRVPMDSMSGAHKLEFKGFTGRQGHGVLMHSRAMRALGGADLDGDESFFYFGGRTEDGKGQGMKKSWKDAIHAQKEEFYETETNKKTGEILNENVRDNKKAPVVRPDGKYKDKTFADLLAEQGENDLKKSKTLYYSPEARIKTSEAAVSGRDMLGIAANQAQIMRATYSMIKDSPEKTDTFTIMHYDKHLKKKRELRITLLPRDSKKWGRYQREMTRAQIAFGSDPLDEAGLKSPEEYFKLLHDAYFKLKVEELISVKDKKTGKFSTKVLPMHRKAKKEVIDKYWVDELTGFDLKGGIYKKLYNVNSANFGRDFTNNRNWTYEERASRNSEFIDYPTETNVILPKMAEVLAGIDYSDHIYKRLNIQEVENMYGKMEEYVKELDWLQEAMERNSFRVKYNDDISALFRNHGADKVNKKNFRYLFEEDVLQDIVHGQYTAGKERFEEAIKGTTWGKRLKSKSEQWKLWNPTQRENILREVVRNAEDFLINDFINFTSILNTVELAKKHNIPNNKISEMHKKSEFLKNQSYMDMKARGKARFLETPEVQDDFDNLKYSDILDRMLRIGAKEKLPLPDKGVLLGDKPTALMDQAKLDIEIRKYKKTLDNDGEREFFDHLLLGSLKRGDYDKLQKIYNAMPENMKDPLTEDLYRQLMIQGSKTYLSRVGFNSKAVHPRSIRQHLEKLSGLFKEAWERPPEAEVDKVVKSAIKDINTKEITMADGSKEPGYLGTNREVDNLVEKGLSGEGFAGIKKGKVREEDKKIITELSGYLREQNEFVERGLNEMLRGLTTELYGKGKDLNAFNIQDFKNVLNYFKETKRGTISQRFWGDDTPDIRSRYYMQFPETIDRELMKYDIEWVKENGYFVTKDGSIKEGPILKPTYYMKVLMNQVNKAGEMAVSLSERLITKNAQDFFFLEELKDKNDLFSFAVLDREYKYIHHIDAQTDMPSSVKEFYKKSYKDAFKDIWKKINWDKTKDKKYTVSNDEGKRITVTGFEVVNGSTKKNLTGIKLRLNKRFEELHKHVVGDRKWMAEKGYIPAGDFFEGKVRTNWKLFVKDMYKMFREGNDKGLENLFEKMGIDGMRYIARDMTMDLVKGSENKEAINRIKIGETGRIPPEMYWPHMFFSKKEASKSMENAIKMINADSSMTKSEKDSEIKKITFRHKSLTGDWEFQDMQQWDRVNRMSIEETLKEINKEKAERVEKVNWYNNANQKMGSQNSRTGHIPGWSTDITVMDAYMRNLSNTFFKHMQQIMARDTVYKANERMTKKFGPELASRWRKFFELYVQGAIGNPDIIPEEIYNDPNMKIKGTPYAWWADNRVLDKVNKIADNLGINKKDLPEELGKFGYNDIRDWSNMEAKYELATLLAHPKTAVTNIFGGSLHTIESVGFNAFRKARDIKFLKRINPEWNSMQDVEKWVIEKGVLPEFLVHELGLGKQFRKANIETLVSDLTSAMQSKDKLSRKDMRTIAQNSGITEKAVDFASKFMSIPERMLRRDAFMAHYIRAWQRFGGAITDPNHPFLIEMGKKGVKATQFLYNAPNRPMFARTALGKVMSRFQLFAWNSVRFRNTILREAKILGFKPGEATDRYARMMQMDLMVMALGSMFMYSLFDNALPPPWNWFQDTANWLFGDEKERNKAFFGELPTMIAPLKTIMPPLSRIPVTALMQWARDDYTKFSEMTVYTMFPFGRMARDLVQPGRGLINNPTMILEKVAGMPVHDLARKLKKSEKDEEKGVRKSSIKPGFKF